MPRSSRIPLERFAHVLSLLWVCRGRYDEARHIETVRLYGHFEEYEYWFFDLLIGTPPQRASVIADTGSAVIAFPCKSCVHCGKHIDPNFDFDKSSSARWVTCEMGCPMRSNCDKKTNHCKYVQSYLEGSSISGWYFQDYVQLGDAIQHNPPIVASMGCHNEEKHLFYTQRANGIVGLAQDTQGGGLLAKFLKDSTHVNARIFAICIAEWGGEMTVGGWYEDLHSAPITWVRLGPDANRYHVYPSKILMGQDEVTSNVGNCFVDSGTTFTWVGSGVFRAFRDALTKYCNDHACGMKRGNCWVLEQDVQTSLRRFPTFYWEFDRDPAKRIPWVPHAYLHPQKGSKETWCLTLSDDGATAGQTLGMSWMAHQDVIFDIDGKKMGVAPAACREHKERPVHNPAELEQHFPTPSPTPPPTPRPAPVPEPAIPEPPPPPPQPLEPLPTSPAESHAPEPAPATPEPPPPFAPEPPSPTPEPTPIPTSAPLPIEQPSLVISSANRGGPRLDSLTLGVLGVPVAALLGGGLYLSRRSAAGYRGVAPEEGHGPAAGRLGRAAA